MLMIHQGNFHGPRVWCVSRKQRRERDVCLRHCRFVALMPHISASTQVYSISILQFCMSVFYQQWSNMQKNTNDSVPRTRQTQLRSTVHLDHPAHYTPQTLNRPLNVLWSKHRPHVPRAVHAHAIPSAVQRCTSSCIADPSSDLFFCCWVRYVLSCTRKQADLTSYNNGRLQTMVSQQGEIGQVACRWLADTFILFNFFSEWSNLVQGRSEIVGSYLSRYSEESVPAHYMTPQLFKKCVSGKSDIILFLLRRILIPSDIEQM